MRIWSGIWTSFDGFVLEMCETISGKNKGRKSLSSVLYGVDLPSLSGWKMLQTFQRSEARMNLVDADINIPRTVRRFAGVTSRRGVVDPNVCGDLVTGLRIQLCWENKVIAVVLVL